jgi:two-component system, NarL family, sensor histidine kinase DegS
MAKSVVNPEPTAAEARTVSDVAARVAAEVATLDTELAEIEMLIAQARTEASRHEGRRAAVAEKVSALAADADPAERADLNGQLVTLTRRAGVMEAQVDVLDGKQRSIRRFRDALAGYAQELGAASPDAAGASPDGAEGAEGAAEAKGPLAPAVSRLLLGAQEDLRREIARAMHDGPAQSLTNIVLQAQIVGHMLNRDPESARTEMDLLVAMVQQTLEATKSFIFDVRPMVLDDLGLVPTLRRATRERGRRTQIPVEFESLGSDRRLPMDLESGLFRMIDEALAAYLDARPDRAAVRLDWSETQLDVHVQGIRQVAEAIKAPAELEPRPAKRGQELPPALAAMIEDRRAGEAAAAEAARAALRVTMPPTTWREIAARSDTLGIRPSLLDDGSRLELVADLRRDASPEGEVHEID